MKRKFNVLLAIGLAFGAFLYGCNSDENKTEEVVIVNAEETSDPGIDYLEEGKKIAEQSQGALGKNLMNAIKTGGTEYAVEFCNIEAIPITDSMATLLGASVKRVTDKPRNPNNEANEAEMEHLKYLKDEMAKGNSPQPKVVDINGRKVGYYAIVTNEMCIKCHGDKGVTIEPATFAKIQKLYPTDKALGYKVEELRGMWVVNF